MRSNNKLEDKYPHLRLIYDLYVCDHSDETTSFE